MSRTEMAYTEVSLAVPDGRRHVVVYGTGVAIDTDPERLRFDVQMDNLA
jgi:hypothetical protein